MRHLITPPDLGDLDALRVGDPLAVLHVERGRAVVSPGALTVTEIDADFVRMKRDKFRRVNGGACSYAMHAQGVAHYYYSANPAHIKEAERLAWEARVERARVETDRASRRAIASGLGVLLGDGERHNAHGESYDDFPARDTLADRLSVEQLTTLCGWLGLSLEG